MYAYDNYLDRFEKAACICGLRFSELKNGIGNSVYESI